MSNQEVTRAEQNPIAGFRNLLERMTSQFEMVMPAQTVARFKRVLLTTVSDNPDLLRCTQRSLISSCMRAAQMGLELDGREAAIVPYRDGPDLIAKYEPMIFGLRKKVRESRLLADWNVQVVQEGDHFDYALGDRPYIIHKPALRGGRNRAVIGAYSIATFPDGTKSFEIMNVDQIEDVRSKSKAKKGPWFDPISYPEMCRKTVARLHAKQLPQSSDLELLTRDWEREKAVEQEPRQALPQRRSGTVSDVLDQFGAGMLSPPEADSAARQSVESSPSGADDQAAGGTSPPSQEEQSAREPDVVSPVQVAYERGKQARAANASRKAIPGEYRAQDRTKEGLAWIAGFDGIDMPNP
jgi:recombination protein RecT